MDSRHGGIEYIKWMNKYLFIYIIIISISYKNTHTFTFLYTQFAYEILKGEQYNNKIY